MYFYACSSKHKKHQKTFAILIRMENSFVSKIREVYLQDLDFFHDCENVRRSRKCKIGKSVSRIVLFRRA